MLTNIHKTNLNGNNSLYESLFGACRALTVITYDHFSKHLGWIEDHNLLPVQGFDSFRYLFYRELISDVERRVHR